MAEERSEWKQLEQLMASRIRAVREGHGLSQQELVEKLHGIGFTGINSMTISRIEKGDRPVRAVELEAIAEALSVPPWELKSPDDLAKFERALRRADETARQLAQAVLEFWESRRDVAVQGGGLDFGEADISYHCAEIAERAEDIIEQVRWRWSHPVVTDDDLSSGYRAPEYSPEVAAAIDEACESRPPSADAYLRVFMLAHRLDVQAPSSEENDRGIDQEKG